MVWPGWSWPGVAGQTLGHAPEYRQESGAWEISDLGVCWESFRPYEQKDLEACSPSRGSGFHVERAAERLFPGLASTSKNDRALG